MPERELNERDVDECAAAEDERERLKAAVVDREWPDGRLDPRRERRRERRAPGPLHRLSHSDKEVRLKARPGKRLHPTAKSSKSSPPESRGK
jgi:hypothetical protein